MDADVDRLDDGGDDLDHNDFYDEEARDVIDEQWVLLASFETAPRDIDRCQLIASATEARNDRMAVMVATEKSSAMLAHYTVYEAVYVSFITFMLGTSIG
ncbi:hypothetical protein QYE76_047999 [Lolium multiflorum]|uniref:Uncharacterized protein n=1 Tax=Lolium multiflorum TaxID=4521 RepID=A0AAD8X228_LOLMU|nr:hypothetical protein QYE76_047999 [Lolium multiflorum]